VQLRVGALEVDLAPEVGGAIARFDLVRGGVREPLLRPAPAGFDDVLRAGCFPLVPFANRIRGGAFVCDGRRVKLTANMAGDPNPLHGQGWRNPWTVEAASDRAARLVFEHQPGEWPWSYRACQSLVLDEHGLSVELTCRNLSTPPMPCGLGLHPYYPCNAETRLDTTVAAAWTIDAQVLPVEHVPAAGRYSLRDRAICGQGLDNGFDGWSGGAHIRWPDRRLGLQMTSSDAARFQVYSPRGGGVFVAEPVQNANAALNEPEPHWPALGITRLGNGEQCRLRTRFAVEVDRWPPRHRA
jgi:aldose 1-epimerase